MTSILALILQDTLNSIKKKKIKVTKPRETVRLWETKHMCSWIIINFACLLFCKLYVCKSFFRRKLQSLLMRSGKQYSKFLLRKVKNNKILHNNLDDVFQLIRMFSILER